MFKEDTKRFYRNLGMNIETREPHLPFLFAEVEPYCGEKKHSIMKEQNG
jgi:hypothetical protein